MERKVTSSLKSAGRLKCEITVPLIVFCRTTADNTSNIVSLTLFFSVQPVYVLPTQNKKNENEPPDKFEQQLATILCCISKKKRRIPRSPEFGQTNFGSTESEFLTVNLHCKDDKEEQFEVVRDFL